jgi:hybrid cluster-associated redox disulfide protein
MIITKETNIAELLNAHPQTAQVFLEYGLHCVGCMAASFDTIEQGAVSHGIDEETLSNLVEDLNLVINEDAEPESSTDQTQ